MLKISIEDVTESKLNPLWFHKKGLSETASGYGRKLKTEWMLRIQGSKKWYRVYCHCFSNCGTNYIVMNKQDYVVGFNLNDLERPK